jgi:hypothetical protein
MAKDPGKTLKTAKRANLITPKIFKNAVGRDDPIDAYRFNLNARSSFHLALSGLKANANVALFNRGGKRITQSNRPGTKRETINAVLDAGTYFVRVMAKGGTTNYKLRLAATALPNPLLPGVPSVPGGSAVNTAPTLFSNRGLTLDRGKLSAITNALLGVSDAEQGPTQLVYKLTQLPQQGTLVLNGVPLQLNATFTQDDINNGRVNYQQTPIHAIGKTSSRIDPPRISGSNVVWSSFDGTDNEIFFYNGTTGAVKQLTNNSVDDTNPQIFGKNVVWQSGNDDSTEIFFYNGTTGATRRLTKNSSKDYAPQISDNYVIWQSKFGDRYSHIQFWNSRENQFGTVGNDEDLNDFQPSLDGSVLAFRRNQISGDTNDGIYVLNLQFANDGDTPLKITSNENLSGLSRSTVVWSKLYKNTSGSDSDVEFWDQRRTIYSVNNSSTFDDDSPVVSDPYIAFQRRQASNISRNGVYLYNIDTASTTRIGNYTDYGLPYQQGISGNHVVWTDGGGTLGNDTEVFFYNGNKTLQLTNDSTGDTDPVVSGPNVAWLNQNYQTQAKRILFYDGTTTKDNFGFTVADGAGGSTSGLFSITIA